MITAFTAIGSFLVSVLFNLVLFILWLRFLLSAFRISSVHPMHRIIRQLTDKILLPIEALLRITAQPGRRYDWVCIVVIAIITLIKIILLGLIIYGALIPFSYLILLTIADVIIQFLNVFLYLLLIRVIMSWVNPHWNHPAAEVIEILTQPLMRLGHRMIPNISGFDFGPIIALIALTIIILFIKTMMPLHVL